MEELDLIENLQRRGIDHITKQIFGYLDYYCLRRAELVSEVWQKAILDGKLWEKLFRKNITLLPQWRKIFNALKGIKHEGLIKNQKLSVQCHRKWCCLLESELELLEWNWSKTRYLEQKAQFKTISHDDDLSNLFDMNGDWIVHSPDRRIAVRNRWTLELEKILQIPIMQIEYKEGINPAIHSVKVNESFIVASFTEHSDLCVWDTKTKDLQLVISDNKCIGRFEGEEEEICSDGLCLFRNLILTCHYRVSDESWIFKLRQIPKNVEDEVTRLYQKTITGPGNFWNFAMDETYIVILLTRKNDSTDDSTQQSQIQIRKTISFEIVNTIQFDDDMPYIFDYHNGLIVTGLPGKSMRLWNVVTGQCVRKISHRENLAAIRFISDKFIVTCDVVGKLKIWDLQAAMKSTNPKSSSQLLLKTIPAPLTYSSLMHSVAPYMAADEFQIVTTIQFESRLSFLYSKTFLGVPI